MAPEPEGNHPIAAAIGGTEAIVVADVATGRIVQWNDAAAGLFGYEPAEGAALSVDVLLPEGLAPVSVQGDRRVLIGRSKDGRPLSLVALVARILAPNGAPVHVVLIVRDLDEHRRVTARLRESEERYRVLFDNNPTMLFTVRMDHVISAVNAFGASHLGYTPEELTGRPITELFPSDDKDLIVQQLAAAARHIGEPMRWELRKLRKDGEVIWVRDVARAIHDEQGILVILLVCEDITALKTLESRLSVQNEQLKHLDRMKNQFVGAVSHELRTPLTTINGYAEFLEDCIGGTLSDEQQQYVARIMESTGRLRRLVDDLLDFSRLEVGEFKLRLAPTDLVATVRAAAEGIRPSLEAAGLKLILETPRSPVILAIDGLRIGQVVTNLLDNARKFSNPGGRVSVSLTTGEVEARCEVLDEGPGVAAADRERLFERFVQLGHGDTDHAAGAGLGLAIARGIVEAHGGRIGVESGPAGGSRFYFVLPLAGT